MNPDSTRPFNPPHVAHGVAPQPFLLSLRFWIPTVICLFALLAIPIAFMYGAVVGNSQVYRNSSTQQQIRIESFLSQFPDAFGDLTVEHASDGWAYPIGSVPQQSDYDRLADALHRMFGDELGDRMLGSVEINAAP
ncbi:hypothetical protein [Allorhodopirellula heiligendammensis]|uniref:Uncharacterized protein n=1 Tax=Allorhodopirellula heiligendammensis TaxID=2714739 RepID=A0A5C6C6E7_9BACT|nr:hypothetical protein [Allorhodopirellula heiligendammensis]TWU19026.1 hypothetical protein Poly21_11970 [Allorhodopirellula heiligendammensis]|tara:strand:+ start:642 stop:1049 length:408 start_codon:yes stop_codon:yes gene_type:complete